MSAPRTTSSSGCGSGGTSTGWSTPTAARPSCRSRSTAEPLTEPAALVAQGDGPARRSSRTAGCATRRSACAPTRACSRARGSRTRTRSSAATASGRSASSTEVYAAVHERLDELLPPGGDLADRYEAWRQANLVPADQVVPLCRDLLGELRAAHGGDRRPAGGRGARDRGGARRALVGVQLLPGRSPQPGRRQPRRPDHTRRRRRARRPRGLPGPPHRALGQGAAPPPRPGPARGVDPARADPGRARQRGHRRDRARTSSSTTTSPSASLRSSRSHGLEYDRAAATAIREARRPMRRIGLDAALMIHEDGASDEEAEAYVRRWALVDARAGGAQRALRHRSDLARLRDQLLRRPGGSCTAGSAATRRGSGGC